MNIKYVIAIDVCVNNYFVDIHNFVFSHYF